jgi:KipI family sensor histidine kinase inhibitor
MLIPEYDISDMGECGLLLHVSNPVDMIAQKKIWNIAYSGTSWPGVIQAIAGVNNLLVVFDPEETNENAIKALLSQAWSELSFFSHTPVYHRIPVRYGGDCGPDLDELAELADLSKEDYIHKHAASQYVVMAIGAQAGFGYLGGLDSKLVAPRRATPRMGIKAGSVIIGGSQTAVATVTSPSGWNVIGQTDMQFFDITSKRPALLHLGDFVEFYSEEKL